MDRRQLLGLMAGGLLASRAEASPHTPWRRLPDVPLDRAGAASGWVAGKLVLAGGSNWRDGLKLWTDQVHAYDSVTRQWETLPPLPAPLAEAGSGVHDGTLVLAGGFNGKELDPRCWRLRRSEGEWRWERLADLPQGRVYGGAAVAGDHLYYVCGVSDPLDLRTVRQDCFRLDLTREGAQWESIPPLPGPARCQAAVTSDGGSVLAFGGARIQEGALVENFGDAWRFHAGRNRWERLPDYPYPFRAGMAVSVPGRTLIVSGFNGPTTDVTRFGSSWGFDRSVWVFEQGRYRRGVPVELPVVSASLTVKDGRIYLAAGEDRPRMRTAAFYSAPLSRVLSTD